MKQRIKIKRAKKELNKTISFVTSSFKRNKQLHIIQKIKIELNLTYCSFSDLLDNIDSMYDVSFDDKEIYNFSDLLR